MNVSLGSGELFAIDFRDGAERIAFRRFRLKIDELRRGLLERGHVAFAHSEQSESSLRVGKFGMQANRFPPLPLRALFVGELLKGEAELVVRGGVLGIVLDQLLQRGERVAGVAVANLNLAGVEQSLVVVGALFQKAVVQRAGFVESIAENEELDVIVLDLGIFGMCFEEAGVLGSRADDVSIGEIKVAEHAVAGGIRREITLDLLQEFFRLIFLAFGDVEARDGGAQLGILRVGLDGGIELTLGIAKLAAKLIEIAQHRVWVARLRIHLDRLLETGFGQIRLIVFHLHQRKVEIRIPVAGIERDGFLHLRDRLGKIRLRGQQRAGEKISSGIVWLFLQKKIGLFLRQIQSAGGDQELGEIEVRGVVVGLQLEDALKFFIGVRPVRDFDVGPPKAVVSVGIVGIEFDGVHKLDRRFGIFSGVEVLLAAGQVFLFAPAGTERARGAKQILTGRNLRVTIRDTRFCQPGEVAEIALRSRGSPKFSNSRLVYFSLDWRELNPLIFAGKWTELAVPAALEGGPHAVHFQRLNSTSRTCALRVRSACAFLKPLC